MENCIFCKIIRREMKTDILWEDDRALAFADINPVKDVHILVVPKEHVEDFTKVTDADTLLSIQKGIAALSSEKSLHGKGFKVVVNAGGAQVIPHLHFHLIGPVGTNAPV